MRVFGGLFSPLGRSGFNRTVLVQKPLLQVSGSELIRGIRRMTPYDKKILVGTFIASFQEPFISFSQLKALGIGQEFATADQRSMYYSLEQVQALGKKLNCERMVREPDHEYYPKLSNMLGRYARSKGACDIQAQEKLIYQRALVKEIVFNGAVLHSQTCPIGGVSVETLGIRSEVLRGGADLCVVSIEDLMRYSELFGFGQGLMGVFNPNGNGETEKDQFGVEFMKGHNRKVLVPDNVSAETIMHEIMHEIFSNMLEIDLQKGQQIRQEFYELVLEKVKACFASPEERKLYLDFFEEISRRCSVPINFKKFAIGQEPSGMLFVNEVFAYSSTFAAGYPSDVAGKPPESIQAWIKERFLVPGFDASRSMITIGQD